MNQLNLTRLLQILFVVFSLGLLSCVEDDVSKENMYTSLVKTMGQYIESEEELSEFKEILERSKVMGLLKSYGAYTCFVPDNEALKEYYQAKGKTSIDDFTEQELKQIAYDHLVNGMAIKSAYFKEGRLGYMTMSNRFLSVTYIDNIAYINIASKVLQKDIEVHNGVLHVISQTIDPSGFGVVEAISKEENFSLFYEALLLTGLSDSLMRDVDETYDPNDYSDLLVGKSNTTWQHNEIPQFKKYGYTVFMESNQTFAQSGINDIESLKAYAATVYNEVYTDDRNVADPTDRRNSLNRFVAYHLVNKELSKDKLIDAYDNTNVVKIVDMYEYIATMCPNTLIEVRKSRSTGESNLINYLDADPDNTVRISSSFNDKEAKNGVYHEIDKVLVYSKQVQDDHSSKRLRFDVASFFPEFTNNNFRGYIDNADYAPHVWFPRGYIEGIETSELTMLGYVKSSDALMNYQGDELFMQVETGKLYDFTISTLPVPAGQYEVRIGYLSNGARGVCQFYFNGAPAGVPLNLNNTGTHESIGWVKPGNNSADPYGYENDKMMRNLGYMKGPASITVVDTRWTSAVDARNDVRVLRKILGIYNLTEGVQTITAKGLSAGDFMLDYVEFVPISAIESEDIY